LEFNPFEMPHADRLQWAHDLPLRVASDQESIELLYWVGCAGSFDPDGKSVARSMIKILNYLNINYRVLGLREHCTGDPARRMGEEGLFQELALQNIDCFRKHSVQNVVTNCPHCFNTFANEYRQFGARFNVEHHSQFLARMIAEKKLPISEGLLQTATFHDPCYLGRGNGETQAPRQVLKSISNLNVVEMPRSGTNSFCCGAGGGSMWLNVKGATRIENLRSQEAVETGAGIVATACPFCKGMLKAGMKANESPIPAPEIMDLAELIVYAKGL
jgi:Fe-S oxidoreductase